MSGRTGRGRRPAATCLRQCRNDGVAESTLVFWTRERGNRVGTADIRLHRHSPVRKYGARHLDRYGGHSGRCCGFMRRGDLRKSVREDAHLGSEMFLKARSLPGLTFTQSADPSRCNKPVSGLATRQAEKPGDENPGDRQDVYDALAKPDLRRFIRTGLLTKTDEVLRG
jgi:hypothetical protein